MAAKKVTKKKSTPRKPRGACAARGCHEQAEKPDSEGNYYCFPHLAVMDM